MANTKFLEYAAPDQVTTAVVLSHARGIVLSGKPPSPVAFGARIAVIVGVLTAMTFYESDIEVASEALAELVLSKLHRTDE